MQWRVLDLEAGLPPNNDKQGGELQQQTTGDRGVPQHREEFQPGYGKRSSTRQPPLDPHAKRLIYKLLADFEKMEQMYKEGKFQHAHAQQQLRSEHRRNQGTPLPDPEIRSKISAIHLDPPCLEQPCNFGFFSPGFRATYWG